MGQLLWHDQAIISHEGLACRLDSFLAVLCQGKFGDAGVSATEGPLGLSVADDEAARIRHVVRSRTLRSIGILILL